MLEIRNRNEALQFLLQEWQLLDDKTKFLVESLPLFGHILYNLSEKEAYHLISLFGQESDIELIPDITNSIFDVVLTIYFSEALAFSNNKEASSALVDALLFQSTG